MHRVTLSRVPVIRISSDMMTPIDVFRGLGGRWQLDFSWPGQAPSFFAALKMKIIRSTNHRVVRLEG